MLVVFMKHMNAQNSVIISNVIISNTFKEFEITKKQKRPFLSPNASFATKLNPLTYISGGMLFLYQNIVSEQIQANCQYHISCSENMKKSIKRKGLFFGILSGLNQLGNCSGSILKDYPNYKITPQGKINNTIE
jgi:putative component of membrane protein insertase Oxa1/YidC/SpoIIIJ protein YidD